MITKNQSHFKDINFSFAKNDILMFELNSLEGYLSLYKNTQFVGIMYENFPFEKMHGSWLWCKFVAKHMVDSEAKEFRLLKHCIKLPKVLEKDDQYGALYKGLGVSSKIEEIRTILDNSWTCMNLNIFYTSRCKYQCNKIMDPSERLQREKWIHQVLPNVTQQLQDVQSLIMEIDKTMQLKLTDPYYFNEWKLEDVFNWIDAINDDEFEQYKPKLKQKIQKLELTCDDIKHITPLALKLMNVAPKDKAKRIKFATHFEQLGKKSDVSRERDHDIKVLAKEITA